MVNIGLLCLWVNLHSKRFYRKADTHARFIWTYSSIHARKFTVKPMTLWFCVWEMSKQITTLCSNLSDQIYGSWLHPPTRSCCVENCAMHKDTLASFPDAISLLIKSECCHPQEFSDEDAEEDIDALMSAHSKTASRRLSYTMSTVPLMLKTDSGKSCMLTCSTNMYKHTHTHTLPITLCVRCECSIVDCLNIVWALGPRDNFVMNTFH